jgi:hypothetical protein
MTDLEKFKEMLKSSNIDFEEGFFKYKHIEHDYLVVNACSGYESADLSIKFDTSGKLLEFKIN